MHILSVYLFEKRCPEVKKELVNLPKSGAAMKYDANASALDDAYGMLAELRRELSDSREDKNERGDLLQMFASCKDSQRAWILLEDYFNKLKLSRKDFQEMIGGKM